MNTGTDGPVYALTVYDGKLCAGGHFVHAGGRFTIAGTDSTCGYAARRRYKSD